MKDSVARELRPRVIYKFIRDYLMLAISAKMVVIFWSSLIQQTTDETVFLHISLLLSSNAMKLFLEFQVLCQNFSFSIVLSDSLKTEGSRSCILWKALFGVFVGLFGVVLLFANRNKVWGLMKICHHSTSQTGDISSELSTSHNNKGQTGDINITGESQGTNGLDLVREDTPQAL